MATSMHLNLRVVGAFMVVLCAPLSRAHAAIPTVPQFDLQLTTARGCIETGQDPVYAVGESITVSYRIGSSTTPRATATLFDILPDGRVGVLVFGQIATNQTLSFTARVARPTGVERLQLKAEARWMQTTRKSCSFTVVAGPTPTATMTPPTTATSTMTPSPAPYVTRTPTPGGTLSAEIRTNRGCVETGDSPVFVVGESILVSFRINSNSLSQAQASILDILPNGFANTFAFGFVRTNATFQFRGRIAPPTGIEVLQLRARTFKWQTAIDTCSFRVVRTPPATATGTRASTVPATHTATGTETPTPTPTPTPP